MAKGIREKIKLESTAGTGHFYTTTKNKRNMPEKMLIKKFDPVARKHVDYKETTPKYAAACPWQRPAVRTGPACHKRRMFPDPATLLGGVFVGLPDGPVPRHRRRPL